MRFSRNSYWALVTLLVCGCVELSSSSGTDFTAINTTVTQSLSQIKEGSIVEGNSDIPCSYTGMSFVMVVDTIDEMSCRDESGATDCNSADYASVDFSGTLTIDSTIEFEFTGRMEWNEWYSENLSLVDFDYPIYEFEMPDVDPEEDYLVFPIQLAMRHSEDGEEPVWESCMLELAEAQ